MEYLVSLICHSCSELLTVLNMSFTHKMPCGECCVLAFSRQDVLCQAVSVGFSLLMLRGTLVPLSVPSNYANNPGQFLAPCEFHHLIKIYNFLDSVGNSVTGVINER